MNLTSGSRFGDKVDLGEMAALTAGDLIYGAVTTGLPTALPIGSSAQVLQVVGGLPAWAAVGSSIVQGGFNTAVGAGTNYFEPMGPNMQSGSTSTVNTPIPRAGTVSNFYVYVSTNSLAGTCTFTLNKNGSNQAVTVQYAAGGTTAQSDLTHSFSVAAGDLICLGMVAVGAGSINSVRWGFLIT